MPRAFHIPGVAFLFCAFVLLLLVSISLPTFPPLDLVRVHFDAAAEAAASPPGTLAELRYGIWGYCWYDVSWTETCSEAGHAYSTTVYNADKSSWQTVSPSWTRGLAVHPAAAGLTSIAFLLSLSTNMTLMLLASLVSFVGALLTLVAFAIDIALYAGVQHQMAKLDGVRERTSAGTGFWMTFVSFILLCLAGCTVCAGRRRDRMAGGASYGMASKVSWRDRFRRQA